MALPGITTLFAKIKGNMFFFIQNFMANQSFRVQIGDMTSEKNSQENGVV
jgi:hypothetical protein